MQMAAASPCVIVLGWGVAGAAGATVFSQYVSGVGIFVDPGQSEIIAAGVHYLRIEGACYIGIGILFLLYGYYRAVNKPMMSVILTIASLGTRVALAYLLSATPLGVTGIWLSVPIGWALADAIGIGYYFKNKKTKAQHENHLPYVPWRDAFQGDGSGRFGAGVVDLI